MNHWVTEAELLRRAQPSIGQPRATPTQLKRLRGHGLLPRPMQKHPQGRRGSTTYYPETAIAQLTAIYRLRGIAWRYNELAIDLWREGYSVSAVVVRRALARLASRELASIRALRRGRTSSQAAEAIAQQALTARRTRSSSASLISNRLGRERTDLAAAAFLLTQLLLAEEPAWDYETDATDRSPGELLAAATGLTQAQTGSAAGLGSLLSGVDARQLFTPLREAGILPITNLPEIIARATDEDLDWARGEAEEFLDDLFTWQEAAEQALGRDALGLRGLAVLRQERRRNRAHDALLVGCLIALRPILDGADAEAAVHALRAARPHADAYLRHAQSAQSSGPRQD